MVRRFYWGMDSCRPLHKFPWHEWNVFWVKIEIIDTCKMFMYDAWSRNPTLIHQVSFFIKCPLKASDLFIHVSWTRLFRWSTNWYTFNLLRWFWPGSSLSIVPPAIFLNQFVCLTFSPRTLYIPACSCSLSRTAHIFSLKSSNTFMRDFSTQTSTAYSQWISAIPSNWWSLSTQSKTCNLCERISSKIVPTHQMSIGPWWKCSCLGGQAMLVRAEKFRVNVSDDFRECSPSTGRNALRGRLDREAVLVAIIYIGMELWAVHTNIEPSRAIWLYSHISEVCRSRRRNLQEWCYWIASTTNLWLARICLAGGAMLGR